MRRTLAEVRSQYCIIQGRQYVKNLINKYFVYRRLEGKPNAKPLPEFKVPKAPSFDKVSINFV